MRHHGNFEKMEEYPPLLKIDQAFLNGRECDVSKENRPRTRPSSYFTESFYRTMEVLLASFVTLNGKGISLIIAFFSEAYHLHTKFQSSPLSGLPGIPG